jgi:hypothetical protein
MSGTEQAVDQSEAVEEMGRAAVERYELALAVCSYARPSASRNAMVVPRMWRLRDAYPGFFDNRLPMPVAKWIPL